MMRMAITMMNITTTHNNKNKMRKKKKKKKKKTYSAPDQSVISIERAEERSHESTTM